MQYEKAPGPNGIPAEAYKALKGDGLNAFAGIIFRFWTDPAYIPEEWAQIKLTILPKKGDLSNPNNWRGIALEDIAAKCVSSRIVTRLTKHLCSFGIDEQCGCIFGKATTDATFTLKSALETLKEHGMSSYVLFVDLVKAFDSANRELLWKVLEIYGVPLDLIVVIQKLHTNVTYQMKIGEKKTEIRSQWGSNKAIALVQYSSSYL